MALEPVTAKAPKKEKRIPYPGAPASCAWWDSDDGQCTESAHWLVAMGQGLCTDHEEDFYEKWMERPKMATTIHHDHAAQAAVVTKIVSGGQTGADRGGLDAAILLEIDHDGWCPQGRTAEDGAVPSYYQLKEAPVAGYPGRTRMNVRDSDATVIFTVGPITPGSRLTMSCCVQLGRQVKHINLQVGQDEAVRLLSEWLDDCRQFGDPVHTLNVAGSRESKAAGIQRMVCNVICRALQR